MSIIDQDAEQLPDVPTDLKTESKSRRWFITKPYRGPTTTTDANGVVRQCTSAEFEITAPQDAGFPTFDDQHMRGIVFQLERGGNSGYYHYQIYMEYSLHQRFSRVKTDFGTTAHIDIARGTRKQCFLYCTKEDTRVAGPWTAGIDLSLGGGQGSRTDLAEAKESLDRGISMAQFANDHFGTFIRYPRAVHRYREYVQPKRSWKPHVLIFYGPTGSGKSRAAFERAAQNGPYYSKPRPTGGSNWWDGYEGEHTVILDDFRSARWYYDELLQLFDRYPLLTPFKGGYVSQQAREYIITTTEHPHTWYEAENHLPYGYAGPTRMPGELLRRVDHIVKFEADGTQEETKVDLCLLCIGATGLTCEREKEM